MKNINHNFKNYLFIYLLIVLPVLLLVAILTIYIDPYFHYHKPYTDKFYYELPRGDQRFINDGIIKNFDYDTIITGTSMSENFSASEVRQLFDCNPIKVPFQGGTFFEISSLVEKAYKKHDVKYVIRSLDYYMINRDFNEIRNNFTYPKYLYNKNIFDDVKYIWNSNALKSVFVAFKKRLKGITGIQTFDDYSNWNDLFTFGKDEVLKNKNSYKSPVKIFEFTDKDEKRVTKNIEYNIISLAKRHPETHFYYFLPPYSIAEWGNYFENGKLSRTLCEEEVAVKLMVQYENIHLFSFNERKDWILNLNNYKDRTHYNQGINTEMLKLMSEEKFRITKENVDSYINEERNFFTNFDYSSIF